MMSAHGCAASAWAASPSRASAGAGHRCFRGFIKATMAAAVALCLAQPAIAQQAAFHSRSNTRER